MVGEKFCAKPPRKRYSFVSFNLFYCQFSDSAEGGWAHSNSTLHGLPAILVEKLVESAEDAEVETLFYTADTAVTSVRERDVRNGFRAVGNVY